MNTEFLKENFKKSIGDTQEYELSEINMLYRNWLIEKIMKNYILMKQNEKHNEYLSIRI